MIGCHLPPYPELMDGQHDIPIGERIRFHRQARKKTQAVVAGLAGVTEDYLSQIERGLKTPSATLLHRLARILVVPTSALFGESPAAAATPGHPVSGAIHAALASAGRDGGAAPDLADLRGRVDSAWQIWQTSPRRNSEAGPLLPGLIVDVQGAVRALRGDVDSAARREAARIAADMYFLLRTFTKRIGRTHLSLLVADRGLRAAEDADDQLRIAAATWKHRPGAAGHQRAGGRGGDRHPGRRSAGPRPRPGPGCHGAQRRAVAGGRHRVGAQGRRMDRPRAAPRARAARRGADRRGKRLLDRIRANERRAARCQRRDGDRRGSRGAQAG